MNRFLSLALVMFVAMGIAARADSAGTAIAATDPHGFISKFNVTGLWIPDGDSDHPAVYTQKGKDVTVVYNNDGYKHTQTGSFVDDHTLVTIQTRENLADHTTTRMSLTYVFDSSDRATIYWVALDSNSDLTLGQTGTAHIERSLR